MGLPSGYGGQGGHSCSVGGSDSEVVEGGSTTSFPATTPPAEEDMQLPTHTAADFHRKPRIRRR